MDAWHIHTIAALGFLGIFAFPLAVGALSSVTHCAAMCGPIHFFLAQRGGPGNLWFYHAGRLVTYTALGAVMAAVGVSGRHAMGSSFMGWLWVALYVLMALKLLGIPLWPAALSLRYGRWVQERLRPLQRQNGRGAALFFPLGLTAGFLPCATTQTGLAWSAGSGNVVFGGVGMLLLGAATLPLFAAPRRLWISKGGHFHQALALALLAFAAWKIYGLVFALPHGITLLCS